jgi:hypothetical protein
MAFTQIEWLHMKNRPLPYIQNGNSVYAAIKAKIKLLKHTVSTI